MKQTMAEADRYEIKRDGMATADFWYAHNDGCIPHFHSSIELVYVVSGELTAVLDGQKHVVSAGHLLLTSSYAVHAYRTEEGKSNDVIVMIIPLASVPSLQRKLNKKAFAQVVYDARRDEEIQAIVPLVAQNHDRYSAETVKGISYFLLGLLIDRVGLVEQPANQQSGLMRDVLIYLQNNYQQPLRMDTLAKQFGYSKSRFSRLFHDHLGCSMIEYLAALRCRQAAQELLESERTMLDIALGVGFECLRTFYRAFKNCYDMTPSQYVKAHSAK